LPLRLLDAAGNRKDRVHVEGRALMRRMLEGGPWTNGRAVPKTARILRRRVNGDTAGCKVAFCVPPEDRVLVRVERVA
jgi:hypothetical protein